jgi:O-antigen/teichoic acid export membrane protein
VAVCAAVAAIFWQVQETTRRALMAELRFRDAIWGDSIRYVGHVAVVAALSHWWHLSLKIVFVTMAGTSLLAALIQAVQLRIRIPVLTNVWEFARDSWKLGRWVLAGNATGLVTTIIYTANFRFFWGAEVVGIAFALNNLLRLTNPLMFSIVSLITPHAARARATEGMAAAKRSFLKFSTLGALLLAPYLGFLMLFPGLSIKLALDAEYQKYWWILIISASSQGLIYIAQVSGVFLNAVERNRIAFVGATAFSATALSLGERSVRWRRSS